MRDKLAPTPELVIIHHPRLLPVQIRKQVDCSMQDLSTFLSADEMTKRRTPRELDDWVKMIFERYRESSKAKAYLRLGNGLCKQLLEEVWPLALLTKQLFGDSNLVVCKPVLGNQNYDALIEDDRGDVPMRIKVEFTIAVDGYDDHLRMEVLNDKGSVNTYGDISVSGTKNTHHKIDIVPSGRDGDELKSNAVRLITEALRRKADRTYGLNCWLCVKFDDRIWVRNRDDLETIQASVFLVKRALNLDFAKVFIVGSSGELLWDLM